MEIGVSRKETEVVAQLEELTNQQLSLEEKLGKAKEKARKNNRDPQEDDEVRKYEHHLEGLKRAKNRTMKKCYQLH